MQDGGENLKASASSASSENYDMGGLGDTYSVDSSITKYRVENGRRYHSYKDGIYWAPNDDKQNENLDISHHKYLLMMGGKLLLAPISKDIEKALDIGTGTGIWAIDFADEYPQTTILGTDLSPIQPPSVPPNCRFEIDDVRDEWLYPPNFWDFIHVRGLFGSIDDWPALYKQAYKHTKPGGFFEQLEIDIDFRSDDNTLAADSPLRRFTEVFSDAGQQTGRTFRVSDIMKQELEKAGFENIVERVFKVPLGGWPADPKMKEIGQWTLLGFDTGLEGYALATLTRVLGWTSAEVLAFTAQCRAASRDRRVHAYHNIKVVYGQKPLMPKGPI